MRRSSAACPPRASWSWPVLWERARGTAPCTSCGVPTNRRFEAGRERTPGFEPGRCESPKFIRGSCSSVDFRRRSPRVGTEHLGPLPGRVSAPNDPGSFPPRAEMRFGAPIRRCSSIPRREPTGFDHLCRGELNPSAPPPEPGSFRHAPYSDGRTRGTRARKRTFTGSGSEASWIRPRWLPIDRPHPAWAGLG
jgi:hypothetical protein